MPASAPPPGACHRCGLPTGDPDRPFCCYGCSLAHELAGGDGEEGQATLTLTLLGMGAFLAMWTMAFSALIYTSNQDTLTPLQQLFQWLQLGTATPAVALLGWPILKNALLSERPQWMDLLILVGVSAAYVLSVYGAYTGRGHVYFETAVIVLVLVTLGRYLESTARVRATSDLRALLSLAPERATLLRDGAEVEVPIEEIAPGDRVVVRCGEAFPIDGEVARGEALVDQRALTGEAMPVAKGPGDKVYAGTVPCDGRLEITALATGTRRLVARLTRLLEEAKLRRAPVERLCERVSRGFLVLAGGLAAATVVAHGANGALDEGVRAGLAVLLVACPCSLGLATPLALAVALGRAAREGAVVRAGEVFEALAAVRTAVFDKTGTLTSGDLRVARIATDEEADSQEALLLAASLESGSGHPIARSIVAEARQRGLSVAAPGELRALPGLGVEGRPAGRTAAFGLGSRRLVDRRNAALSEHLDTIAREEGARGRAAAFLLSEGRVQAVLALSEDVRPEAGEAVRALQEDGLQVEALTGDGPGPARALAEALSIPVQAELLPDEKLARIEALRHGGGVVMIGDGLNDAPALGAANVGIAVKGGTDLAIGASDISLLTHDLRIVPRLVRLARRTVRTIRVNLLWSFLYNSVGMAFAATGRLHPALAAVLMVLSSLLVVGQSFRLRGAKL